jgi:hypothetical protein
MSGSATAAGVAKSKYQAAMKAAGAQNVHYVSTATDRASRSRWSAIRARPQVPRCSRCRTARQPRKLSVVLIGKTGYLRGNVSALEKVLGLTAAQSSTYENRWLSFPTSNRSLSELVSGLLDSEVAPELEMTGPYTFGGTKMIGGHLTQAIKGTAATSSGTKVPIVLYVESTGTPRPVQEVTNPNAKSSAIRGTVTFSNWGEVTQPVAPATSVPLVPLLPAG